ncbi:hypothetical protein [Niabella hibiscisoli]|uniref:hypothetical protein n=1 Tax=Niabella hibiscisoli TaxID=1825928 RepID=UPI001F108D97|nr:hypothetical protein [Niabella hibiscisoli]MCH5718202.1 hypothetical protein [Niabella hibiscisoli]
MVVQRTPLKQAYRIRFADGACKPPEGAVVKSHGAERSGKDAVRTLSGAYKEAEHH